MQEVIFNVINKSDYLLFLDNNEIYVKRSFGGFTFISEIYINNKLMIKSKLIQILLYRKLKIVESKITNKIHLINNNTFKVNNEIITYKTKILSKNPNYSFYSNDVLILECYVPPLLAAKNQYRLKLYSENENLILYIICFFIIFSLNDISSE